MASAADHYEQAESLAALAEAFKAEKTDASDILALAQVHATLAVAAALGASTRTAKDFQLTDADVSYTEDIQAGGE